MEKFEDHDGFESEVLLEVPENADTHYESRTSWKDLRIILVLSVLLNLTLIASGVAYLRSKASDHTSSYTRGFSTDLDASKSEIDLVQQHFTGGVELDAEGKYVVDGSSTSQKYVGHPSPAVDEAWSDLLLGLNMNLDAWEAADLSERSFRWPDTGNYFTGLDVFHSLHCLNRLRQALYPEYYKDEVFNDPMDPDKDMHLGHCINHIRQAIQCHADLTPMEWVRVDNKLLLRTNTKHTCRDFEKIRRWASEKGKTFNDNEMVRNGTLYIVD